MKKTYTALLTVLLVLSLGVNVFAISRNVSNDHFEKSLQKVIQKLEIYDNADYDYKSIIIMAESGLGLMKNPPQMDSIEKDPNGRLPEGYELYRDIEPGINTYLRYEGQRLASDDTVKEVDEWYGPY